MPPRGHAVQFYNTDDQLLRLLTRYVGTALVGGDVAVVVATRSHLWALEQRLASRGLDVVVARRERRFVTADAHAMLDELLTDGRVDEEKAEAVIGALLRPHHNLYGDGELLHVFVFGELVTLLSAQCGAEEAVRLEEIWNDLAGAHEFTLCCGYPMSVFTHRDAAPFVRICGLHSNVFHALPIPVDDFT